MLLNVLGLFLFETFTTTDVIQPCSVYEHGPKGVDQEGTLNCFSIMPSSFTMFQSSVSCLFFPPKVTCWLMLWDIVERGKVLSCSSDEI